MENNRGQRGRGGQGRGRGRGQDRGEYDQSTGAGRGLHPLSRPPPSAWSPRPGQTGSSSAEPAAPSPLPSISQASASIGVVEQPEVRKIEQGKRDAGQIEPQKTTEEAAGGGKASKNKRKGKGGKPEGEVVSKPSTSVEEQLQKLTIEPSKEAAGPSEPQKTVEEAAGGEKTSKGRRKGKGAKGRTAEDQAAKAEEPEPSGTPKPVEVNPAYKDVPRRRREKPGFIHDRSMYFEARTTMIEVNYLPIQFSNENMKIFHYDIDFPQNANKDIARTLLLRMKNKFFPRRNPAYDGAKNLYAAKDPLFSGNRITETIKIARDNGKEREYTITIKRAAENVELTIASLCQYMRSNDASSMYRPQSTIQAVEVAIRGNLPERFVSTGRAFYTKPERYVEMSAGLELYSGFIQGAVLGQNKAFINVDVSHRGFYTPQPLLDYLEKVLRDNARSDFSQFENGLSREVFNIVNTYISQNNGLKMRYEDPRTRAVRVYRMKRLSQQNAKTAVFELTDGNSVRKVSVYDYFYTAKQYPIKYPKLPVIEAGSKGDFFPMECCSIEERQPVQNRYKYSAAETRQMIANCKDLPDGRKFKIMNSIRTANFNGDPVLREFGISVGDRGNTNSFLQVQAANLLSPTVVYRDGDGEVQNGVWKFKQFTDTVTVTNWILVNMNRGTRNDEAKKLEDLLVQNARTVGMHMARAAANLQWNNFDERYIEQNFMELKRKNSNLELVVVILPSYNEDTAYRRVKYVSEIKVGLLTQCVKPETVRRVSWMTAQNLLVKINSKMSGASHEMHYPRRGPSLFDGKTMFVGADVTHPSPGSNQQNERSISAVAGSYDKNASKYKMLYCIQDSREEMIQGMERMIMALLMFFAKNNQGQYPTKLYYYRDGVSDGQFATVLNTELGAIHSACRKLKVEIKVMFLVVQKRHHTRFFPPRGAGDKKGNVYAGTVVNNTITHPTEHDFYLVSHQSIQGTARPTKYHVLYDEIQAPEDYVEALTYYLCYMFVRCSRSVSYPAPTYYAHLAAARAERYVKCVKESNTVNLQRDLSAGPLGEGTIHYDMRDRNPMYFV